MVIHGDSLAVLKGIPDNSVDSIVTDPPYGLSFMGKKWDYDVPSVELWAECLRVLKPGGHLLAFAGTRTQHRMAVRIEDAGFEIRDMIAWVYGSGFPKSLDVSKAIDKAAGVEFDSIPASGVGFMNEEGKGGYNVTKNRLIYKSEQTDAAKRWAGWGTALKPSLEPITVARKPLTGTVAENVLACGTGAINVDGCRIAVDPVTDASQLRTMNRSQKAERNGWGMNQNSGDVPQVVSPHGRWPANLITDGSEEVVGLFPNTKSGSLNAGHKQGSGSFGKIGGDTILRDYGGDSGSAARFFYCAKASKRDRDEGCEGMEEKYKGENLGQLGGLTGSGNPRNYYVKNHHPTVKPTDLMRYLVRLVTPKGGTVLDPFSGSGSTGKACVYEGMQYIGIERELEYVEISRARIAFAEQQMAEESKEPKQGELF